MLRITSHQSEFDIHLIHRFLSEESTWARGIPLDLVQKSIANSLCFAAFIGPSQVAFARVITDYATFANLVDVFVLDNHRGKGYSRELMEAVLNHPELQGLRRFTLVTSSAHGLYEKFGFSAPAKPSTLMEHFDPGAYKTISVNL